MGSGGEGSETLGRKRTEILKLMRLMEYTHHSTSQTKKRGRDKVSHITGVPSRLNQLKKTPLFWPKVRQGVLPLVTTSESSDIEA